MLCLSAVVYSTSKLFLIPIITLLIVVLQVKSNRPHHHHHHPPHRLDVLQVKSDRPLLDEPLHLGLEGGGQDPHQGLRGKPGIKSLNNELLVVVGVMVVI